MKKMIMSPYVIDLRQSYNEATGMSIDSITIKRVDYEQEQWKELEESLDFAKPKINWLKRLKK